MELTRRIRLYPAQSRFFQSKAKVTAFIGGIRSGKTYVGIIWAISQAQVPGQTVLIVAPTYPMLRDIDWRLTLDLVGEAGIPYRGEMTIELVNGGRLLFRSGTEPDRLRGLGVNAALIDEAAYCPESVYNIVLGRVSLDPGFVRIVTTPRGRNWLYRRSGEMQIERASTYDNRANLPGGYIEALEASYSANFARQELLGEFVAHEGLVYDMFDQSKHVKPTGELMLTAKRWVLGVDEGYINPAVVLVLAATNDGVHVVHEWYRRGEIQSAVVSTCASFAESYRPEAIVVDSSAAGLIAALRDADLPAVAHRQPAGQTLSGVKAGIARIQAMLATDPPRLTVAPECVCTIAEFESYSWKEGRDEPEKQGDHAMDALRYAVDYLSGYEVGGASMFAVGENR